MIPFRKSLRVLHGPVNFANQPWTLSRAERRLGHHSDVVVNYSTQFAYPADRIVSSIGDMSRRSAFLRSWFALTAPLRYNVFHYYFGRSFMLWDDWGRSLGESPRVDRQALRDVRIARLLGRRLFMTLQGCDVRIAGDSNKNNKWTPCAPGRCGAFEACLSSYDNGRRAMLRVLLPLMDRVFYLNPELGRWVPNGTFLPYANVDIKSVQSTVLNSRKRLRILHAPSDPNIKGTKMVLDALQSLSAAFDFEVLLVQDKTHAEAMELYRTADFAIDQVLAGWYGGFAVEVMAMGKPVAAYIREEDQAFVPPQLWKELPILTLRPNRLRDDLASILARAEDLGAVGARSRAYVERWHDPDRIAAAMTRLYRDPKAPFLI